MADIDAETRQAVEPPPGFGPVRPGFAANPPPLRLQVYDAVRSHGALSRLDVARQLGVSPATVTVAVSDLLAKGLLREVDGAAKTGSRGRPPVTLVVETGAGLVAGIKVSNPVSSAVLTDFGGTPVASATAAAPSGRRTLEGLLDEAERLLDALLAEAGRRRSEIASVGLGLPGTVDFSTGTVLWSPVLRGGPLALREAAEARFGRPVIVDNDANLVTLAELWFGAGRTLADFAVVTIEQGVGMGLVMDHRLFRGSNRVGLELGHTTVQIDGALCRCGKRGCLEAYVSDYALVREAEELLGERAPDVSQHLKMLETLHRRAKKGDRAAREVFSRGGRYLALGIANVISLYDPSVLILSGARLQFDFLYTDEVLSEIRQQCVHIGRLPRIEINAWGDLVWARGAAALALEDATARLIGAAS